MAASIDWYFDFVSPYSYLALHRLKEFSVSITYKPVLFAGILNHWGQKGPAEIPAKRKWTYRSCVFEAHKLGVPFRFPALHPFNPLPHLRLALACGCEPAAVKRIFDFVWTTGEDASDAGRFASLCADLGSDPSKRPEVKDLLRRNTDEAIAAGVFGVPSFVIRNQVFWGADSIEFANAFLADAGTLDNDEMRRVDGLPAAATRSAAR
ncbi:MAG TPA: 2-hydroxychromene-2-carboxylate isomerase [Burkholderiales bacterium]|jgi:2-hydroxychromene-2-carboxylate isomerase